MALCCAAACAGPGSGDRQPDAAGRTARIEALRQAIAEDHETLQTIVSTERGEQAPPIYAEPAIRAIARRLGPHEDELARLLGEASSDGDASRLRR